MNTLLVVNGPPGASKSTFLEIFSQMCQIPVIIVGALCREEKDKTSKSWLEAKAFMETHNVTFWPNNLMIEVLQARLNQEKISNHLVLDSFPYTMDQMLSIPSLMEKFGLERLVSIEVHLDEQECIRRAKLRGREDDKKIVDRLANFYKITRPALNTLVNLDTPPFPPERICLDGYRMRAIGKDMASSIIDLYNLPRKKTWEGFYQ